MRVLSVELHNFSSYEHIKFDMSDKGLTLISGPTGAGKSTLCDAIPWLLFGTTAKNGAVDEVRSWFTDDDTSGSIVLELNHHKVLITRARGKNNDLSIATEPGKSQRGKDLKDTQRLINAVLGFDETAYLAGAYFHEFSQVAQFFTTSAKTRRQICDELVDLTLANKLQIENSANLKLLSKESAIQSAAITSLTDKLHYIEITRREELKRAETFEDTKQRRLDALLAKHQVFETKRSEQIATEKANLAILAETIQPSAKFETTELRLKDKLANLDETKCPTCGAKHNSQERADISASLYEADKRRIKNDEIIAKTHAMAYNIDKLKSAINPYESALLEASSLVNSHYETTDALNSQSEKTNNKLQAELGRFGETKIKLADAEVLAETLSTFRSVLIQNTIVRLQDTTNNLISEHFDGELQVALAVEASDKLNVEITKDGNSCVYTQLSKGQRCVLKLCFSVAVMKTIANHQALSFNALFFDEALDGCSDLFKEKAYGLFSKLSLDYENVFVVDHSEALKSMFVNKIEVTLHNGRSIIND